LLKCSRKRSRRNPRHRSPSAKRRASGLAKRYRPYEMALSVLNEIKDLPSRVSDPNWLDKLENGDGEQA
jgi:hypothetical protein